MTSATNDVTKCCFCDIEISIPPAYCIYPDFKERGFALPLCLDCGSSPQLEKETIWRKLKEDRREADEWAAKQEVITERRMEKQRVKQRAYQREVHKAKKAAEAQE